MTYDLTLLEKGCKTLQIDLSENQKNQFLEYYKLLIEWNKVMNLTAITEFQDVIVKHFLDSLALSKVLDLKGEFKMIDIGTGAGFPGIPLKIMFPELKITLLDSLKKRTVFLKEVSDQLSLGKVEIIHGRAEEYAKNKDYRESFDIAVSRAVANLATLSEYCLPYVKQKGHFVSYKSGKIEEELEMANKAIHILGGSVKDVCKFNLEDTDMTRSLIVISKVKNTPGKYPRKAGLPGKEPLN